MKNLRFINYCVIIFFVLTNSFFPQSLSKKEIVNLAEQNLELSTNNLKELLSIPNVAFIKEDIRKNIDYIISKFRPLGFNHKILPTEGNPQLFIEKTMDIRLVPENDPERLIKLVRNHIAALGYHFVNKEPTEEERMHYDKLISFNYQYLYPAFRTDFGTTIDLWLTSVMKNIFGNSLIKIRQTGGSVPISFFIKELNVSAVLLTMVNMDDNQHSPNENIRLGNYFEGIQTCLSLLTTKIDH